MARHASLFHLLPSSFAWKNRPTRYLFPQINTTAAVRARPFLYSVLLAAVRTPWPQAATTIFRPPTFSLFCYQILFEYPCNTVIPALRAYICLPNSPIVPFFSPLGSTSVPGFPRVYVLCDLKSCNRATLPGPFWALGRCLFACCKCLRGPEVM